MNIGKLLKDPRILTGISVAGVVVTAALAVKAGPELKKHAIIAKEVKRKMESEKIPVGEIRKQSLRNGAVYLKDLTPTIISGSITIGCILGSTKILMDRNTALIAAYKLSDISYKELVRDVGEEKVADIVKEREKTRYNAIPPRIEGRGDVLCFETYSGRYFWCTSEHINLAKMKANERLAKSGDCSLNYFYHWLGLDPIPLGNEYGWTTSSYNGMIDTGGIDWINFRNDSFVVDDNTTVLMIDYSVDSLPGLM